MQSMKKQADTPGLLTIAIGMLDDLRVQTLESRFLKAQAAYDGAAEALATIVTARHTAQQFGVPIGMDPTAKAAQAVAQAADTRDRAAAALAQGVLGDQQLSLPDLRNALSDAINRLIRFGGERQRHDAEIRELTGLDHTEARNTVVFHRGQRDTAQKQIDDAACSIRHLFTLALAAQAG